MKDFLIEKIANVISLLLGISLIAMVVMVFISPFVFTYAVFSWVASWLGTAFFGTLCLFLIAFLLMLMLETWTKRKI